MWSTTALPTAPLLLLVAMAPGQAPEFGGRPVPPERTAAWRLTTQRCTACHGITRVIKANIEGPEWAAVVARMQKKEKSGLSALEAATIAEFLAWWSASEASSPLPGGPLAPGASSPVEPPSSTGSPGSSVRVAEAALDSVPGTLVLGPVRVLVHEASVDEEDPPAVRVRVEAEGREVELVQRGSERGGAAVQLRAWTVGGEPYRLVLVLDRVEPRAGSVPPRCVMALHVERPAAPPRRRPGRDPPPPEPAEDSAPPRPSADRAAGSGCPIRF
jgi:hypothetical protein